MKTSNQSSAMTFGGLPRFGFASSASISMAALRQVSYSTRLFWMRCGALSLCLSKAVSSSVISRPFKVMRDVVFSQQT